MPACEAEATYASWRMQALVRLASWPQMRRSSRATASMLAAGARALSVQLALESHQAGTREQPMEDAPSRHNGHQLQSHVVHEGENSLKRHCWMQGYRWHLH